MNRKVVLQRFFNLNFLPKRTCRELPEGIKYYGFTYYPRSENFKDPPYEPTKLFLIKRIKSMKGRNKTERKNLELLNIDGNVKHKGHINIVKNIPSTNALLWKVKHIVEIKPIRWKGELPKDDDYSGTFLRETGEFLISQKLKVTSEEIEATEKVINDSKHLSRKYLKDYLKKIWLNGFSSVS